jgi:hypothetical protein
MLSLLSNLNNFKMDKIELLCGESLKITLELIEKQQHDIDEFQSDDVLWGDITDDEYYILIDILPNLIEMLKPKGSTVTCLVSINRV